METLIGTDLVKMLYFMWFQYTAQDPGNKVPAATELLLTALRMTGLPISNMDVRRYHGDAPEPRK